MSKDAKLGLILGIALVIVIAVVFFRKDPSQAKASTDTTAAAVKPKPNVPGPALSEARPTTGVRQHIVMEGENLFTIAERYYGDRSRFILIFEANRDRLATPERPTPGTVLIIPE